MTGTTAPRAVIIGGGLAGISAALLFNQAGLPVTVLERDNGDVPRTPAEAAAWARSGVPHLHQTHGFLGAFHQVLRDRLPGVLHRLREAGAGERDFGADAAQRGYDPANGADLTVLLARRSTVELVFRQAVAAEPRIAVRTGARVTAVCTDRGRVTGVRTAGQVVPADLVIDASGRHRQPWLDYYETLGDHPGQMAYVTRNYELAPGAPPGPMTRVSGAGVIADGYHTVINMHDNRTFSAVIACSPHDREVLTTRDAGLFETFMRAVPGTGPWIDQDRARPLAPPAVMSNMRNRLRNVSGRAPAGFFAIGDSLCTTDPARGYGASIAVLGAAVLADSITAGSGDRAAARRAFDEWLRRWVAGWYHDTVAHTVARGARWQAVLDGADVSYYRPVSQPVPAFVAFQIPARDEAGWWLRRRYSQLMATPGELEAAYARQALTTPVPPEVQTVMEDAPTRAQVLAHIQAQREGQRRERVAL